MWQCSVLCGSAVYCVLVWCTVWYGSVMCGWVVYCVVGRCNVCNAVC